MKALVYGAQRKSERERQRKEKKGHERENGGERAIERDRESGNGREKNVLHTPTYVYMYMC